MRQQFPQPFRRYTGIVLDVVFDHFLAREWASYKVNSTLDDFATRQYQLLADAGLSNEALRVATSMQARRALQGYEHTQYPLRALAHISTRLKRDNPLQDCEHLLATHENAMHGSFKTFFPQLEQFVADWISAEQ